MIVTLTPEIETAIAEQARHQGMTPERLVSKSLQKLFASPARTPNEILGFVGHVYAGLSQEEVDIVEEMVRTTNYGQSTADEQDVSLSNYGISTIELRRGIIEGTGVTTMADTMTLEPNTEDYIQHKAQIDYYLGEMKRLNGEMAADQPVMDALKVETRMLASETRTILSGIWALIARIEAL